MMGSAGAQICVREQQQNEDAARRRGTNPAIQPGDGGSRRNATFAALTPGFIKFPCH